MTSMEAGCILGLRPGGRRHRRPVGHLVEELGHGLRTAATTERTCRRRYSVLGPSEVAGAQAGQSERYRTTPAMASPITAQGGVASLPTASRESSHG